MKQVAVPRVFVSVCVRARVLQPLITALHRLRRFRTTSQRADRPPRLARPSCRLSEPGGKRAISDSIAIAVV